MNELLAKVVEAHGGVDRWKSFEKIEATYTVGGGLFKLKGRPMPPEPRQLTVWLREERTSVMPYGALDQRFMFIPEMISIEKLGGEVLAARRAPRDSFAGHVLHTPWDELHRAYFSGYAMWTYLTTPFLLTMDGVIVEETEPWREKDATWRVLCAHFPPAIETHCRVQDFFFGENLMLRRHDYVLNVAGGQAAAQLIVDYIGGDGIRVPSQRRAYGRGPDRRPIPEMLMVSIDIDSVRFT